MLAAVTCSAVEDNHDCQIQSVLDKHGPNEYINVQLFKHLKNSICTIKIILITLGTPRC